MDVTVSVITIIISIITNTFIFKQHGQKVDNKHVVKEVDEYKAPKVTVLTHVKSVVIQRLQRLIACPNKLHQMPICPVLNILRETPVQDQDCVP